MTDYAHLLPEVARLLDASNEERLRHITSPQWIRYPTADRVLRRFEFMYNHAPTHRPPNALIVGATNNGKTVLARRFIELVSRQEAIDSRRFHAPIVMISAPTTCELGHFYGSILKALGAQYGTRGSIGEREFQVISLLGELRVKMLVIDEIQEVVRGGQRKQRSILNAFKNLSNKAQIPLVGLGTHDSLHAVQADPQLANRFRPIILESWEWGMDYLRLLASYEKLLPLRCPSNLTMGKLARRIFDMSDGLIGEMATILVEAASHAVIEGEERICHEVLDALNWDAPSKRKGKEKLLKEV